MIASVYRKFMKTFNKLVRDRIPEIVCAEGKKPVYHRAQEDFFQYLKKKLREEVEEFCENPCIEEIVDILEVLSKCCEELGLDEKEITAIKKEKASCKGRFDKKIVLEMIKEK